MQSEILCKLKHSILDVNEFWKGVIDIKASCGNSLQAGRQRRG